jgi:2-polyprenyl-6-hydroxyphenyl methylase/3-demethylubiquinone-9 3-methyltransferase
MITQSLSASYLKLAQNNFAAAYRITLYAARLETIGHHLLCTNLTHPCSEMIYGLKIQQSLSDQPGTQLMTANASKPSRSTIDQAEVDRFSAMAAEWWSPTGKFRPLHKFNPVRLTYIKEKICARFDRDIKAHNALEGLRVLDIGCGGGLLSEPIARMGASVIGADASKVNIEVAKIHAAQSGVEVDYRATTAEDLALTGEKFDVVLNMEVVEHVSDVDLFMSECCRMVKPGGLMFVATINRTMKAQALAIFMAENVLRWLPKGTHTYDKLVKPAELEDPINNAGMRVIDQTGVFYNPILDRWNFSRDMDVNYMILAERP